jgi:hypothetical protein
LNKEQNSRTEREKIKYYNVKAKERDNSVREIKSAIAEDME